jgi:hypothetical protein
MSYKKIEVIDQLKLTYDLLNIIKSYCFYDISNKIEETKQHIKYKKSRIVFKFKYFIISRGKSGYSSNTDIMLDDESEYWTILNHDNRNILFTLEATNCKCCGNYKTTSKNFQELPKIIKCSCI